jgi:enoyl-[acyl-carrier-protein] reductase (NADH)
MPHGIPRRQAHPDHRRAVEALDRLRHRQGLPPGRCATGFHLSERALQGSRRQVRQGIRQHLIFPCDVAEDAEIERLFAELGEHWDGLEGLVHSIAYAPSEAIEGDFLDGITRDAFRIAHDVSSYSYPALAKAARPLLLKGRNPALLALSYLGAERTMPNYNTMGLAKASLEAATRYLAFCLGPQGIRANAISAGPIKTLAASGIGNFSRLLAFNAHTRRYAATSPSTKSATPPPSCSPTSPAASPARSCTSMAD